MSHQIEQGSEELSLGERFRQAREALNLSLEEASKKVNLHLSILQQIENNEFVHKNIPATFMNGYVRNYGKYLKLPAVLWENVNFGEAPKNDLNKNERGKRAANPHSSNNRWVTILSILVLAAVLGMTALWWWENYQQSNSERDNLVQTYVATEEPKNSQTNTEITKKLLPAVVEAETKPMPTAVETSQPVAVIPAVVESTPSTMMPVVNGAETAVENSKVLVMPENSSEVVNNDAVTSEVTVAPETAMAQGDLQIEVVAASSWISVKDGKGKKLTQKEYKQGEILTFQQQGPYALIIGAPSNVKITYKGEAYPLKIDGRVARFKLQ